MFVSVLQNGDEEIFEKFIKMFKHTNGEEERMRILNALCAVRDENLINKLLEFSFSVKIGKKL